MALNQLGRAIMKHQGDYSPTTDYVPLDCCYHEGSTYFCKAATTGNAPPNATYWVLMSTSASTVDRDAAEAAAQAAAGSATTAANQVTLAEAQVGLAQGHATTASTKATAAANSATAASDSAAEALASAGNAEVSAGEAETAATAAQASANDAAASAASVDGAALMAAVESKAAATHAHGDITTDGRVGTTPDLPLFTGPNGIVVARTMAEAAQIYQYTNPNILHNWDFRQPVNQRGVSGAISTGTYFFDRWIRNSGTATVAAGYLTLASGSVIEQRIEGNLLAGVLCTVSFEVDSTIYHGSGAFPTNNGTVPVEVDGYPDITFGCATGYMFVLIPATSETSIKRVKCEMGFVSTLHLDPPTDWGVELPKCHRFLRVLNQAKEDFSYFGVGYIISATLAQFVLTGLSMRAGVPTVQTTGNFFMRHSGPTQLPVTDVAASAKSNFNGGIYLEVSYTGTPTLGAACSLYSADGGTILLSREL